MNIYWFWELHPYRESGILITWMPSGISVFTTTGLNRRLYNRNLYFSKVFYWLSRWRMYPRISLQVLATIACRHAPSGQRYGWVGGTSPHGVFDTHTDTLTSADPCLDVLKINGGIHLAWWLRGRCGAWACVCVRVYVCVCVSWHA